MAERFDVEDRDWPLRPLIMAAIGAVGGLVIYLLTDRAAHYGVALPVWKQAGTSFTAVAVLAFLLTVELRRWTWAIAFALGWGAVIALVGWFTARYNHVGGIFEFPFFSGILAVLIAAPLFQTIRDEGAWRFPYARLHRHAWTDAVIGAASLGFTGVTFLLAWLIASLFDVIGIDAIKDLLEKDWFGWMLAGFAFGAAVGLLRERDALLATLQKLAMVALSVLAPILAVALAAFLISLPFTGLHGLWDSDIPATPMLLLSGAGAILMANAIIGDGREERSASAWLRRAALLLVVCVLPLAILSALSMGQRINQYGWTPERIWGVIAVAIAIAYGAAAWWAAYKGREDFDEPLRPLQVNMAIGLCGLALFLALPILDFGAISARSQLARLETGKVKPEEFDWTAMAFDFGKSGREKLAAMAKTGPANVQSLAKAALQTTDRYRVPTETKAAVEALTLDQRLRILSPDIKLTDALRRRLTSWGGCGSKPCVLMRIDAKRLLLVSNEGTKDPTKTWVINLDELASDERSGGNTIQVPGEEPQPSGLDLTKAQIEIRTIERRQAFVDGKPVGEPFE